VRLIFLRLQFGYLDSIDAITTGRERTR